MNEAPNVGRAQCAQHDRHEAEPERPARSTSRATPAQLQPSSVRRVPSTPVPATQVSAAGGRGRLQSAGGRARARAGSRPAERDPDDGGDHEQDLGERVAAVERERDRDDPGAHHDRAGGGRDRVQDPASDSAGRSGWCASADLLVAAAGGWVAAAVEDVGSAEVLEWDRPGVYEAAERRTRPESPRR